MRSAKILSPAQQDMLKFAFATLLSRTQGKGFTKDEQDGICEAWELVRDPKTDEPLIATVAGEPVKPVEEKPLIQTLPGKWAGDKGRAQA